MADSGKDKRQCFMCKISSDEAVLLACEDKREEKWVCVRCLPPLIHGR